MKPDLRKITAASVGVVYFCTQVAFGAIAESNIWMERRLRAPVPSASLLRSLPALAPTLSSPQRRATPTAASGDLSALASVVPSAVATLQSISRGPREVAPVIILQDVHLNPEAQANSAEALLALMESGRIGLIGVEGAFRELDFRRVRAFSDPRIPLELAQAFLRKGQMAAPSFAGIAARTPVRMIGVDDERRYRANVQAFLSSQPLKPRALKSLRALERRLDAAKIRALNAPLRETDALRSAYRANRAGLGRYVTHLLARRPSTNPELLRFAEAFRLEKEIDFARADGERRRVIEKLAAALNDEEMAALLSDTMAYRDGRLGFAEFYRRVEDLCCKKTSRIDPGSEFGRYLRYAVLADAIRAEPLLRAVEEHEAGVIDALTNTEEERALLELSDQVARALKLVDFSLTPPEWRAYRLHRRPVAELASETARWTGETVAVDDIALDSFEAFYREADVRSEHIVRRLMEPDADGARALVIGGFHTPHVQSLLEARGIPVLVFSPKITRIGDESASEYLSVFAREKAPLDQLFKGEALFINPTTVNVSDPVLETRFRLIGALRETATLSPQLELNREDNGVSAKQNGVRVYARNGKAPWGHKSLEEWLDDGRSPVSLSTPIPDLVRKRAGAFALGIFTAVGARIMGYRSDDVRVATKVAPNAETIMMVFLFILVLVPLNIAARLILQTVVSGTTIMGSTALFSSVTLLWSAALSSALMAAYFSLRHASRITFRYNAEGLAVGLQAELRSRATIPLFVVIFATLFALAASFRLSLMDPNVKDEVHNAVTRAAASRGGRFYIRHAYLIETAIFFLVPGLLSLQGDAVLRAVAALMVFAFVGLHFVGGSRLRATTETDHGFRPGPRQILFLGLLKLFGILLIHLASTPLSYWVSIPLLLVAAALIAAGHRLLSPERWGNDQAFALIVLLEQMAMRTLNPGRTVATVMPDPEAIDQVLITDDYSILIDQIGDRNPALAKLSLNILVHVLSQDNHASRAATRALARRLHRPREGDIPPVRAEVALLLMEFGHSPFSTQGAQELLDGARSESGPRLSTAQITRLLSVIEADRDLEISRLGTEIFWRTADPRGMPDIPALNSEFTRRSPALAAKLAEAGASFLNRGRPISTAILGELYRRVATSGRFTQTVRQVEEAAASALKTLSQTTQAPLRQIRDISDLVLRMLPHIQETPELPELYADFILRSQRSTASSPPQVQSLADAAIRRLLDDPEFMVNPHVLRMMVNRLWGFLYFRKRAMSDDSGRRDLELRALRRFASSLIRHLSRMDDPAYENLNGNWHVNAEELGRWLRTLPRAVEAFRVALDEALAPSPDEPITRSRLDGYITFIQMMPDPFQRQLLSPLQLQTLAGFLRHPDVEIAHRAYFALDTLVLTTFDADAADDETLSALISGLLAYVPRTPETSSAVRTRLATLNNSPAGRAALRDALADRINTISAEMPTDDAVATLRDIELIGAVFPGASPTDYYSESMKLVPALLHPGERVAGAAERLLIEWIDRYPAVGNAVRVLLDQTRSPDSLTRARARRALTVVLSAPELARRLEDLLAVDIVAAGDDDGRLARTVERLAALLELSQGRVRGLQPDDIMPLVDLARSRREGYLAANETLRTMNDARTGQSLLRATQSLVETRLAEAETDEEAFRLEDMFNVIERTLVPKPENRRRPAKLPSLIGGTAFAMTFSTIEEAMALLNQVLSEAQKPDLSVDRRRALAAGAYSLAEEIHLRYSDAPDLSGFVRELALNDSEKKRDAIRQINGVIEEWNRGYGRHTRFPYRLTLSGPTAVFARTGGAATIPLFVMAGAAIAQLMGYTPDQGADAYRASAYWIENTLWFLGSAGAGLLLRAALPATHWLLILVWAAAIALLASYTFIVFHMPFRQHAQERYNSVVSFERVVMIGFMISIASAFAVAAIMSENLGLLLLSGLVAILGVAVHAPEENALRGFFLSTPGRIPTLALALISVNAAVNIAAIDSWWIAATANLLVMSFTFSVLFDLMLVRHPALAPLAGAAQPPELPPFDDDAQDVQLEREVELPNDTELRFLIDMLTQPPTDEAAIDRRIERALVISERRRPDETREAMLTRALEWMIESYREELADPFFNEAARGLERFIARFPELVTHDHLARLLSSSGLHLHYTPLERMMSTLSERSPRWFTSAAEKIILSTHEFSILDAPRRALAIRMIQGIPVDNPIRSLMFTATRALNGTNRAPAEQGALIFLRLFEAGVRIQPNDIGLFFEIAASDDHPHQFMGRSLVESLMTNPEYADVIRQLIPTLHERFLSSSDVNVRIRSAEGLAYARSLGLPIPVDPSRLARAGTLAGEKSPDVAAAAGTLIDDAISSGKRLDPQQLAAVVDAALQSYLDALDDRDRRFDEDADAQTSHFKRKILDHAEALLRELREPFRRDIVLLLSRTLEEIDRLSLRYSLRSTELIDGPEAVTAPLFDLMRRLNGQLPRIPGSQDQLRLTYLNEYGFFFGTPESRRIRRGPPQAPGAWAGLFNVLLSRWMSPEKIIMTAGITESLATAALFIFGGPIFGLMGWIILNALAHLAGVYRFDMESGQWIIVRPGMPGFWRSYLEANAAAATSLLAFIPAWLDAGWLQVALVTLAAVAIHPYLAWRSLRQAEDRLVERLAPRLASHFIRSLAFPSAWNDILKASSSRRAVTAWGHRDELHSELRKAGFNGSLTPRLGYRVLEKALESVNAMTDAPITVQLRADADETARYSAAVVGPVRVMIGDVRIHFEATDDGEVRVRGSRVGQEPRVGDRGESTDFAVVARPIREYARTARIGERIPLTPGDPSRFVTFTRDQGAIIATFEIAESPESIAVRFNRARIDPARIPQSLNQTIPEPVLMRLNSEGDLLRSLTKLGFALTHSIVVYGGWIAAPAGVSATIKKYPGGFRDRAFSQGGVEFMADPHAVAEMFFSINPEVLTRQARMRRSALLAASRVLRSELREDVPADDQPVELTFVPDTMFMVIPFNGFRSFAFDHELGQSGYVTGPFELEVGDRTFVLAIQDDGRHVGVLWENGPGSATERISAHEFGRAFMLTDGEVNATVTVLSPGTNGIPANAHPRILVQIDEESTNQVILRIPASVYPKLKTELDIARRLSSQDRSAGGTLHFIRDGIAMIAGLSPESRLRWNEAYPRWAAVIENGLVFAIAGAVLSFLLVFTGLSPLDAFRLANGLAWAVFAALHVLDRLVSDPNPNNLYLSLLIGGAGIALSFVPGGLVASALSVAIGSTIFHHTVNVAASRRDVTADAARAVDRALTFVRQGRNASVNETMAVLLEIFESRLEPVQVGEFRATGRRTATTREIIGAMRADIDRRRAAGELNDAERRSLISLLAFALTMSDARSQAPESAPLEAAYAASGRQLDVYQWLSPRRSDAVSQAVDAVETFTAANRDNDEARLILVVNGSDAQAIEAGVRRALGAEVTGDRIRLVVAGSDVWTLMKESRPRGTTVESAAKRASRHLVRDDAEVAANFFELNAPELSDLERAELARLIQIAIILSSLNRALPIDRSLLPNYRAYVAALSHA